MSNILKSWEVRAAASPGDSIVTITRGVKLTGGAATITLPLHARQGINASYFLCKEATFNASGELTVNTTAIGATDTVTVVTFVEATEGPY